MKNMIIYSLFPTLVLNFFFFFFFVPFILVHKSMAYWGNIVWISL